MGALLSAAVCRRPSAPPRGWHGRTPRMPSVFERTATTLGTAHGPCRACHDQELDGRAARFVQWVEAGLRVPAGNRRAEPAGRIPEGLTGRLHLGLAKEKTTMIRDRKTLHRRGGNGRLLAGAAGRADVREPQRGRRHAGRGGRGGRAKPATATADLGFNDPPTYTIRRPSPAIRRRTTGSVPRRVWQTTPACGRMVRRQPERLTAQIESFRYAWRQRPEPYTDGGAGMPEPPVTFTALDHGHFSNGKISITVAARRVRLRAGRFLGGRRGRFPRAGGIAGKPGADGVHGPGGARRGAQEPAKRPVREGLPGQAGRKGGARPFATRKGRRAAAGRIHRAMRLRRAGRS